MQLPILDHQYPEFPDPSITLTDPDGLLAMGGNLSTDTLLSAYYRGYFLGITTKTLFFGGRRALDAS